MAQQKSREFLEAVTAKPAGAEIALTRVILSFVVPVTELHGAKTVNLVAAG